MAGKSRDPPDHVFCPAVPLRSLESSSARLNSAPWAVSAPVSLRQSQVISVITDDNTVADLIPTYF